MVQPLEPEVGRAVRAAYRGALKRGGSPLFATREALRALTRAHPELPPERARRAVEETIAQRATGEPE